jgi:hypothetical protein
MLVTRDFAHPTSLGSQGRGFQTRPYALTVCAASGVTSR